MMRKLLFAYSVILAAPILLANCGNSTKKQSQQADQANQEKLLDPKAETMQTIKQEGNTMLDKKIKTDSGLEYITETPGTGETPQKGKHVTVHYTGWLDKNGEPDTKAFDSSFNRNQPFTFIIGIGQVIKGWDEGVMSMKVGEKRRLFIPAALGYGARGAGAAIPPNADLIFNVELLKVS